MGPKVGINGYVDFTNKFEKTICCVMMSEGLLHFVICKVSITVTAFCMVLNATSRRNITLIN